MRLAMARIQLVRTRSILPVLWRLFIIVVSLALLTACGRPDPAGTSSASTTVPAESPTGTGGSASTATPGQSPTDAATETPIPIDDSDYNDRERQTVAIYRADLSRSDLSPETRASIQSHLDELNNEVRMRKYG